MNRANGELPPGPKGQFLIGHTLRYMRDPLGFIDRAAREYGDAVRLRLGPLTTYVLRNPEHISPSSGPITRTSSRTS